MAFAENRKRNAEVTRANDVAPTAGRREPLHSVSHFIVLYCTKIAVTG